MDAFDTAAWRRAMTEHRPVGASMLIAALAATPFGISGALPAFTHPLWLAWGIGVGICSSVIPYVTDQLAMARLPWASFALMLALLPATATVIGLLVLGQVPTVQDLAGIGLVIAGVAPAPCSAARTIHRPAQRNADPGRCLCLGRGEPPVTGRLHGA